MPSSTRPWAALDPSCSHSRHPSSERESQCWPAHGGRATFLDRLQSDLVQSGTCCLELFPSIPGPVWAHREDRCEMQGFALTCLSHLGMRTCLHTQDLGLGAWGMGSPLLPVPPCACEQGVGERGGPQGVPRLPCQQEPRGMPEGTQGCAEGQRQAHRLHAVRGGGAVPGLEGCECGAGLGWR